MKKIIPMIAIAGLALTACGSDGNTETVAETQVVTQTVQSTVVETQKSTPKREESLEDTYIRKLDEQGIEYGSRENGIRAGNATCAYIAEGYSVDDLFYEMALYPNQQVLPGIPNEDLPKLMGVAVAIVCPEFLNTV